jgi:hypothetical protein
VLSPLGLLPSLPGTGGGGALPPHLAILPVRVALQLLSGMPRHFLLLTNAGQVREGVGAVAGGVEVQWTGWGGGWVSVSPP